ncbi:16S rRNA (cytosine(967)-C(5))-methyltransferase [Synechococcus sp. UW140]|uniref:16S rRNA (cytosine(967)-C(5))-methyltransferase n=1 Tax=Synechococcus sp. UW140 TaxID=368503 RepID=UPI000E0E86E4|nr:16S rRNA (cytosine(967)-C(5))-methyltransferase [Synechococcus sp. UW140]
MSDRSAQSASPAAGVAPRRIAWEVLEAVAAGAYADVALERALRGKSLASVDRGLVTELAYGAIRQRRWLDGWLDRLGRVPALKQPPRLRWLLHLGLYQLLFMQRIPAAAAVNTSVELAKQHGLARLAPVVNGLLRAALRARDLGEELELPLDPALRLALQQSLPDWFCQELQQWCSPEQAERVARACNQVPPLDLRVNRLRSSPAEVRAALEQAGLEVVPIPECPDGLQVLSSGGDLRRWPGYDEGHWCVQDRAAQWVSPLLDPQPGDKVLDACAAPGGKATHIAELMGDRGEVWAVDRSAGRLQRVAANAARLGTGCLQAMTADAAELLEHKPQWRSSFQRILLDAPCSGLGTLARHADARWRVSAATVAELLPLQTRLLEAMLPLLAPGGTLVYATCTIHPAENGDRIKAFLEGHPELTLTQQQQRWPDPDGGDGFYAAVIEAPVTAPAMA